MTEINRNDRSYNEHSKGDFDILLIGSGVIGSVYGTQLVLSGQQMWVYAHSERDSAIAIEGITIRDAVSNVTETCAVELANNSSEREYDLVLVAVRADQLNSTFPVLLQLAGAPHIVFFGNNPDGHAKIPHGLPGSIELGFPGIGGVIHDKVVEYVHIPQQHTTLEAERSFLKPSIISKRFESILNARGFPINRTADIDGWLAYHAVLLGSITSALIRSGIDADKLGHNHPLLKLMCQSIEEGFAILKKQSRKGLPQNLAFLHCPLLRPFAIRYWAKTMRSPMGELCFAAHTRHATDEMRMLAHWVSQQAICSTSPHRNLDGLLFDSLLS